MTAERWKQVKQIFERVRYAAPQERDAVLDQACGADLDLRREVESLLHSPQKAGDLTEPPAREIDPQRGLSLPGTQATELMPRAETDWSDTHLQPASSSAADLRPGMLFGNRYQIIRSLGTGGMGAVYLAQDREVDRAVALKVVRPDLAGDPTILRRFRQELVLARQVTHPNIVRIFDLGIGGGIRFISMEYVEGRQLSSIIEERGKLPPREVAELMLQVCRGLLAAHSRGVIHRDLKPANIMVDNEGRAVVMDFGIARSGAGPGTGLDDRSATGNTTSDSMTQLGILVGTPIYMSPEQAKGEVVDARSDLFTIGIIFYELLTGDLPFLGKSLKDTLRKRSEEAPFGPSDLDSTIPKALNQIVLKCLRTNPADRYQEAGELVTALEHYLGIYKAASRWWKWTAATLAGLLLGAAAFVISQRPTEKESSHQPLKILISDLENKTADPVFTGALEPLLSFAMEDTSFVASYDRTLAHKIGSELKPGTTILDTALARLVAIREGINVVIDGSVTEPGGRYRVAIEARDSAQGSLIKSSEIIVRNKNEVLQSIAKLTDPIRKALGDATPSSVKQAAAETFSSASLEAAQKYAQAQDAQQKGNWEDAVRLYQETLKLDANSGRAYSGLASTLKNLGRRQEAQKYYELALTKLDRMSDREKYRTRGGYFLFMGNAQQAFEQNSALVKAFPADTAGLTNLAYAYFLQRDMATAKRMSRQAVDIYPGNVLLRSNAGLFAMYAGDFDEAIQQSQQILKINPRFDKALLCIALSQLGQGKPEGAAMTWQQLASMDKDGASSAATGLADLALYEGRFTEVIKNLPSAIIADVDDNNVSEAALKQIAVAQAYLAAGQKSKAVAAAEQALNRRMDEPVAFPAAEIFLNAGMEPPAQAIASKLKSSFDPVSRAYAGVIEGLIAIKHKDYQAAVSALQAAQKLSDTWVGRVVLARAYVEAGVFLEAESESDNAIQRRGEATAVFFDDEPSLRYLPAAYYYRARAREGLRVSSAGDDYRTFLGMKAQSEPDALVADAKRRLGQQ